MLRAGNLQHTLSRWTAAMPQTSEFVDRAREESGNQYSPVLAIRHNFVVRVTIQALLYFKEDAAVIVTDRACCNAWTTRQGLRS